MRRVGITASRTLNHTYLEDAQSILIVHIPLADLHDLPPILGHSGLLARPSPHEDLVARDPAPHEEQTGPRDADVGPADGQLDRAVDGLRRHEAVRDVRVGGEGRVVGADEVGPGAQREAERVERFGDVDQESLEGQREAVRGRDKLVEGHGGHVGSKLKRERSTKDIWADQPFKEIRP